MSIPASTAGGDEPHKLKIDVAGIGPRGLRSKYMWDELENGATNEENARPNPPIVQPGGHEKVKKQTSGTATAADSQTPVPGSYDIPWEQFGKTSQNAGAAYQGGGGGSGGGGGGWSRVPASSGGTVLTFPCGYCSAKFTTAGARKRHLGRMHPGDWLGYRTPWFDDFWDSAPKPAPTPVPLTTLASAPDPDPDSASATVPKAWSKLKLVLSTEQQSK